MRRAQRGAYAAPRHSALAPTARRLHAPPAPAWRHPAHWSVIYPQRSACMLLIPAAPDADHHHHAAGGKGQVQSPQPAGITQLAPHRASTAAAHGRCDHTSTPAARHSACRAPIATAPILLTPQSRAFGSFVFPARVTFAGKVTRVLPLSRRTNSWIRLSRLA